MDISATLVALTASLRENLDEVGEIPLCFVGVVPGSSTAIEYAGGCSDDADGMAWVRLTTGYPSKGIGTLDQTPGNCGSELSIEVEVGVARSVPVEEEAPTEAEALASADQGIKDMLAIKKTLMCFEGWSSKDFVLGQWTPLGPQGGMAGGQWLLYLVVGR